jgi:hypothetical protein
MDVNLKRVGFGALLAAAVLLPLRKSATVVAVRTTNEQSARYDTLLSRYHTAHLAWSAFDLRDSAIALLARIPDSTTRPVVAWRGFGDATNSAMADSLIEHFWRRIGAMHPSVRTAVMVYNAQRYPMPRYEGALVRREGGTISCVAIVPGHLKSDGQLFVSDYELDGPIAPCALIAAFGAPGTGVGDWLAETRFAAAQSNRWLLPHAGPDDWHGGAPWVQWLNSTKEYGWADGIPRWVTTVGALDVGTGAMLPYDMGGAALHCIAGERADCVTGVLHSALRFPAPVVMPSDLTQGVRRSLQDAVTVETVRPPSPGFTSALITTFGRDKFQRFWSSELPFEQAFQAAFGESLGSWTARWSRASWQTSGEARYMSANVTLGVTLKPSWLLLSAVWSIVAVAIAGRVAQRRTAA